MSRDERIRRLGAELVGTYLLVATVVGSGIMASRLAGGNAAIALLCNTLPTVAILVVLISIFGPISGAHFNPAVTAVFAARGEHPRGDVVPFVVAQVAGGVLGAILANLMFDLPPFSISTTERVSTGKLLSEVIATAGLIGVIIGSLRAQPASVPANVGLYIGAAYWFTASTSFANPAVTIARMFSDTYAGIAPSSAVAFIATQMIGAGLGTAVFGLLFRR